MSEYIYAIHEFGDEWANILRSEGKSGWTVTTHALGHDANDRSGFDFAPIVQAGITPVARLNNGYYPDGTIPAPERYAQFASRCANFVAASPGCVRWIIGNEPNLSIERPFGQTITARQYADCFIACRRAIRAVGLQHQVIVGAVGPYNAETGDWIAYQKQVLEFIANEGGAEGIALHGYLRTHNPSDVVSEARMSAPGYEKRYNSFRTYRDTLAVVPAVMQHLPAYFTEFNPLAGWQDANSGVVQAAYAEIDRWNHTPGTQKILFLALFRWPKYDDLWWIEGKQGVLEDFRAAVKHGYKWPGFVAQTHLPSVSTGGSPPAELSMPVPGPLLDREIDPRLALRGVRIKPVQVAPGESYWRVKKMYWLDTEEAEAVGPDHHILGEVVTDGARVAGLTLLVSWPDGTAPIESKLNPGFAFNYDYAMSKSLSDYSIRMDDGKPSEEVVGIGMGKDGNSAMHTSTWIGWDLVRAAGSAPSTAPAAAAAVVTAPPPDGRKEVPTLVHPVAVVAQRTPSQLFGGNKDYYKQFKVDGVPLEGHNGVDFPTPVGSPIRAAAAGTVVESWTEAGGYGTLIKLVHEWGETLYAHLSETLVKVGERVEAGQVIARSGNSGKTRGAHLHFGMRINPYNRRDGWGGYIDPLNYLNLTGTPAPVPLTAQGIDPIVAAAILEVETRGTAFGPGGRMVIRFEPHIFMQEVERASFEQRFVVGQPAWAGEHHRFRDSDGIWRDFHGPINSHQQFEYRAFDLARSLNAPAAYRALAMGVGQVMGFNAQRIGYASAEQMFNVLSKSVPAQMMAFVNFVLSDAALLAAVNRRDFAKVAELYNGSGQIGEYAALMQAAYDRLVKA